MSSLLGLVMRFYRPASCISRPAVFFSSTTTLPNRNLDTSREMVKEILTECDLPIICDRISQIKSGDIEALKINLQPSSKDQVIPEVDVKYFPEKYVLPKIHSKENFDIKNISDISDDNDVRTFALKLNWAVESLGTILGTVESKTDTMLYDLLHIVGFNNFPLAIRNHQECKMFIGGHPYLVTEPEFLIKMTNMGMIAADDKHLKNIFPLRGFGEHQLAIEMLAYANENVRETYMAKNQTIYAVRVISTYITFYKAMVPAEYWKDLDNNGLPQKQSVSILRWPKGEAPEDGLDIAEPKERRKVLEALVKIRQFFIENGN